jgi:hypothetical protein
MLYLSVQVKGTEMYDAETSMMDAYRERQGAYAPLATMSDAHREWHFNAGVPIGQPGCPQDACHVDDYDEDFGPALVATVRCGCGCKLRVPAAVVRSHFGLLPKATLSDLR